MMLPYLLDNQVSNQYECGRQVYPVIPTRPPGQDYNNDPLMKEAQNLSHK